MIETVNVSQTSVDDMDADVGSIKSFAKRCFDGARGSHDWEHTLRVYSLCERIGPVEGGDVHVLRIAALLHDIGRCHQDRSSGAVCHAEKGVQLAWPQIERLPLTESRKRNIAHCIGSHRFRGKQVPESIEARVLFDADKLDAIGAVGVARAFLFAGEVGAKLHNPDMDVEKAQPYSQDDTGYREYRVKLRRIKDRMMTAEGRKLADKRHEFMVRFFERFLAEYEGKG